MNVQMQFSGLIILMLLLYFYKRQETVGLYTEKLFRQALYVTITCLILDIISIVMITFQHNFPLWLVKGECKAYLVTLLLNGYIALKYAYADANSRGRIKNFVKAAGLFTLGAIILIFALPINMYCEGRVVYTYGLACIATYFGALALILTTLFMVIKERKSINPKRHKAIVLWMGVWMFAALLQFLNNRLLLVGFASAMGMVILFFELENPEANIDKKTGFFNAYSFFDYMKQRYRNNLESCLMLIALDDTYKELSPAQDDAFILELARFLQLTQEKKAFKMDDREFILVFENHESLDRAYHMIEQRFDRAWIETEENPEGTMLKPYYIIIPSAQKIGQNEKDMMSVLKYFRVHCMNMPEKRVLIVDEESVNKKHEREQMLIEVVTAMREDRTEVFFQPIYSTKKKKFVSAEALVRIRDVNGKIIPPGLFIPVAEETGLISKLGEIVFEKTCSFIKQNDIEQYGMEYVEVNLSVVQCESKLLSKIYESIMEKYEIPPRLINLEITESASIVMKNNLLENMHNLMDYGVSFSLDDFGNGQSNLNYIVDMPVKLVKFDRDMTNSYFESDKAKLVLKATLHMVHEMGLKVVSEGVETKEQLDELERIGVDYIQGYYFSKPIDAPSFIDFLKEHN